MDPIIAKCGYRCDLCLIHEANLKGEEDKRRMSEALAKYYACQLAPEMIRPCRGCAGAEEPPDKECQVFPCVREKGMENCGQCPQFGCDTLRTRMDVVEECLRKHPDISEEDYRLFFLPYLSTTTLTDIHKSLEG
jgi:hypothetical protein